MRHTTPPKQINEGREEGRREVKKEKGKVGRKGFSNDSTLPGGNLNYLLANLSLDKKKSSANHFIFNV